MPPERRNAGEAPTVVGAPLGAGGLTDKANPLHDAAGRRRGHHEVQPGHVAFQWLPIAPAIPMSEELATAALRVCATRVML